MSRLSVGKEEGVQQRHPVLLPGDREGALHADTHAAMAALAAAVVGQELLCVRHSTGAS